MAHITLSNISKSYGKVKALSNINLELANKEFFVLFGPAGAGKTTLLKTIAGIERQDEGDVSFGEKNMNLTIPAYRNVSMVFENYALFPHLNVYDNIASPLRSKLYKESPEVIDQKIHEVASMMKIDKLLERLPSQLSNGQRQRVALGRSLVRNPNIFLMDEPLAHLDAKLRNFMRTELKEIQQKLDTTTIYVTHDYLEAMSLGDRIGIIDKGKIIQIGKSEEIYYYPCNEFVAKLLGEPEINIIRGKLITQDNTLFFSNSELSIKAPIPADVATLLKTTYKKDEIDIGIRGNNIKFGDTKFDENSCIGTLDSFEPIGNKTILVIKSGDMFVRTISKNDFSINLDSQVYFNFNLDDAMFFDVDDKNFITCHFQDRNI
jgi:ABC-type sugar transport system ATPase subunit